MKQLSIILICLFTVSLSYGQDYAIDLDGQDDYVEISDFPDITTNFTVTAWIRTDARTYPLQRIFTDDRHELSGDGWGFSLTDGGYGILNFYSRTTTPKVLYSPDSMRLVDNVWYFVAAVADITNHKKYIYINGKLAASVSYTGNWGIDTGKASIGGININTPTGMEGAYFNGQIDNVTVWNKALSQGEIEEVMCAPADPSKPDILGIWRFNEGSGTVTADESGNGYHGTFFTLPYNGPIQWVASTVPQDCSAYFPPKMTMADIQVTEGSGGTTNAPFVISLDRPSPVPVHVTYSTSPENINNNDFIPARGTITIPANTLQVTVNISIVGDLTDEYSESFRLNLYTEGPVDQRQGFARCIILDDDIPPGVRVNDTFAIENSGHAVVRISLIRPSAKTASVKFNTNNQTALARYDYVSQYQGSITFAPGETSKYINVALLDDAIGEPTENFRLILYQPLNLRDDEASGGKTIGFVSIQDDDNSAAVVSETPAPNNETKGILHIKATPNPSSAEFNISISGTSENPIILRITDMLGKTVETRTGIRANSVQRLGAGWRPGIYFAEIIQANRKKTLRLVKTQ